MITTKYANRWWLISETGNSKENPVLSWEVRFKVAVGIAEALNYLHNECSPPVIHRDVKSSNVLLSDEFEPQVLQAVEKSLFFSIYNVDDLLYFPITAIWFRVSNMGAIRFIILDRQWFSGNVWVSCSWVFYVWKSEWQDWCLLFRCGSPWIVIREETDQFRVCQRPRKLGHVGKASFLNRNFYFLQAYWLV